MRGRAPPSEAEVACTAISIQSHSRHQALAQPWKQVQRQSTVLTPVELRFYRGQTRCQGEEGERRSAGWEGGRHWAGTAASPPTLLLPRRQLQPTRPTSERSQCWDSKEAIRTSPRHKPGKGPSSEPFLQKQTDRKTQVRQHDIHTYTPQVPFSTSHGSTRNIFGSCPH